MATVQVEAAGRALVLCEPQAPLSAALGRAICAADVEVVGVTRHWFDLLRAVVETGVDVAVIDLAMAGRSGIRLVPALRSLAPQCEVVVLSDFPAVNVASLEAGALAVIDPSDLRPLTATLRERATAPSHG